MFSGNLKVELAEANSKIIQLEKELRDKENEITEIKKENNRYKEIIEKEENTTKSEKENIKLLQEKENKIQQDIENKNEELKELNKKIEEKQEIYIELDDAILLQNFDLYEPQYNFMNSQMYKDKLNEIREKQKKMIKNNKAAICEKKWSIEGSIEKGKKFTDDNIKQILKTFNIECENVISKVKFNNFESSKKRIQKSFNSLNKLNYINQIKIEQEFLNLKMDELRLAYEYSRKVQEEKEEIRQKRELQREEQKAIKELEEKRIELEKEKKHYSNVLESVNKQILEETQEERKNLLIEKRQQIENNISEVQKAIRDVDYRQANQRAGYVYIISNIGSFGENIYKIGMTRRLDPQDRVDELGDASVPFKFDVHAFIFSDDAPRLEATLHKAFEDKKVNMINGRKEFFNVSLEEIEKVVKENHDKTVEFKYIPDAEQYRESCKIKQKSII